MSVERLSAEHIPAVAEMEKLCFSEPWSENSLGILTGDGAVGFVALEDGLVTAYVGMMLVLDEGQITNVATFPKYRRQGFGRAVMEALERYARDRGITLMSLEVRESNLGAVALYESLGWRSVGRRKNFYRHPVEDALVMIKEI